ncbi:class I SAM-dependent methyltransferase [Roseimaritima sediminicola]|uniref:class I SAM-dependent methyltransferase n=1 Tax=Roseimaritima sediminicola TaxID=2662066 RepID=UPI00129832C8|nr:methyltransferase domain-containing protein [Roseimaritima sediminicola]
MTHVDHGAIAELAQRFHIRSMLDVGCGPGGTREMAERIGATWAGIDGDPTVAKDGIVTHDFTTGPIDGDYKADLIWCVEFVEHVEERFLPNFLPLLCGGTVLVLTAAPPGKPGHHHVHCQPPEYWIERLQHGGMTFDDELTAAIRSSSTMKREFMRSRGMCFISKHHHNTGDHP